MVPNLRNILSITHLVFVLTHAATQARVRLVDTLPTFSDAKSLKSVVVDRNHTGDVFVGGFNVLYRLSADLELKQNVSIGPVEDYPGCLPFPYACRNRRIPMDNQVRLLKLVYDVASSPLLLLCGSVYRSLCQVRPLDNLTQYHWVHPYNETLGYTTNPELNYALLEPGYEGQTSLFTSSYVSSPMSPLTAPYLSSKVLKFDRNQYYFQHAFQNDTFSSVLTFKSDKVRLPIDGGFMYEGFIYLPLTAGNSLSSRLARFCSTDPTFRTYQELPIQCNYRNKIVKRLFAASLGPSRIGDSKKTLYLSFNDDKSGSAFCFLYMSEVVKAFDTWPRICNRDIVGEKCDAEEERLVESCGGYPLFYDGRPYVINRTLELDFFVNIPNITVVALSVIEQYGEVVTFQGNTLGHIIKINVRNGQVLSVEDMLDSTTTGAFLSPFVFDREEKHIYLLIKNKIIKYPVESCGIYETCHKCFVRGRKDDPLKCGWCAGRCTRAEECADSFSTDTCSPTIYEVFPKKGPIQGGNTVTITGDSFGTYVDDALTSITVAGIPCKSPSWSNNQINCTLGSTPKELSGPLELSVTNTFSEGYKIEGSSISEFNFSYYEGVRLYGIQPSKGPTSGGTLVRLYGENLDDVKDKKCMVSVYGRPCILQRFDKSSVSCIIQNSTDPKFSNSTIAIHVDGVAYLMDENPPSTFNLTGISQSFEYTPDPYINHIRPGLTTLSGLMNLTVFGRNLDSIQFPKLVVKLRETQVIGESEMVEDCWTDPEFNGTKMTCRTPSLKNALIFPPATRTHPIMVLVSFLMDGVQKLKDFPKHREDLSRLLYYPDPELQVFHKLEKVEKNQKMFEIKGKYLDLMHLADNLQVRIGSNETCKIASVSSDSLFCELPQSLLTSSFKTNISVEVYVGNKEYHLGFIDIDDTDNVAAILVLLLLAALLAICFLALFLCWRRIRGKKPISIGEIPLRTAIPHDYRAVPAQAGNSANGAEIPFLDNETMSLFADNGLIILKKFLDVTEKKIGKGEFGNVFEGYLLRPNKEKITVAVKTLRDHCWSTPDTVMVFLDEALCMLNFNDPNVLGLYGVCIDNKVPSIVLPFMENGDLLSFIRVEDRVLNKGQLLRFAIDISAGMGYLEKERFIHRDLAARNCLLDRDHNVKVSDFGLSRDIYRSGYYTIGDRMKARIPIKWSAPETLESCTYTHKTDVWSYGVVLWELMTRGIIPYSHVDDYHLLRFLKEGNRLDWPKMCPKPLYQYAMQACWNPDPEERPTFLELNKFIRELLNILVQNVPNESIPAYENIPASHTAYHNSEELYLGMEGRRLDGDLLNVIS